MNAEIASAMGRFFTGGTGPRHSVLTALFIRTGYGEDDPYDPVTGSPNKETRVRTVLLAAMRRTDRVRQLVDGLLAEMRVHGCFDPAQASLDRAVVSAAQQAFGRSEWELTNDGRLQVAGLIDIASGGRPALDEQLDRLRRASDDPALLLGTSKELLESTAKFVLEELGVTYRANADFNELWYHARDRLGIHPASIPDTVPGAQHVKTILQSAWAIADQTNQLRGLQGTGHGRTLPTGITAEMALLVVREACSIVEFTLRVLDRTLGR